MAKTLSISRSERSVYPGLIKTVLETAGAFGVDRQGLLESSGISEVWLDQPEYRIAIEHLHRLVASAIERTGTLELGLFAGRMNFISGLNLQLYMTTICHTFRDYLNLMPSVLKMTGDIGEVKIRAEGDFIKLVWLPLQDDPRSSAFLADMILAGSARIVDTLCVMPVPVRRVELVRSQPPQLELIRSFLGDDVAFGQTENSLFFDRSSLELPLVKQQYATRSGAAIPFATLFDGKDPSDKFWAHLRQAIVMHLSDGPTSLDRAASSMNMSRRTLQRKLADRDTTFKKEVQSVRMELAERYLGLDGRTVTEVAYLLGYADQSTFSSAFQKWHGVSPRAYQRTTASK